MQASFIGKEALSDLLKKPMATRVVMLSVDTKNCDPEGDETVLMCGKPVGFTTSGCFSPALGEEMEQGSLAIILIRI